MDGDVIDHFLHFLEIILERVELLTQVVVLEIEKAKAVEHFVEESCDEHRSLVIALGNAIHAETRQLIAHQDETGQVVLQVQMKTIIGVNLEVKIILSHLFFGDL